MKSTGFSRRQFLRRSTAGAATLAIGRHAFSANEKLSHACIGAGGMGAVDLSNFKAHPKLEIVAICDVDRRHLDKAAALLPNARRYTDWRELLAKEGDRIDSINLAVPDHMHAAVTMTALAARKHVYCQKPLCHDVAECRAIAQAAKTAAVVTQLGTQHASGVGARMAVQFLREGVIGKAKRAILCSNRTGAVEEYRLKGPRPAQGERAPADLLWDLWLGTAPERPFVPGIYHPTKWRAWQDFGTGWSGDIGCHVFDAVWKGLGLATPKTVVAEVQKSWEESVERRADNWPQWDHITWTFPANERMDGKEFVLEWFDGERLPPEEIQKIAGLDKYPEESAMVIGTEGALLLPLGSGPLLFPREKFQKLPRPQFPPRNHYHHFVDACLGGEMTESHFGQTGPMAEAILLGTVAIRTPGKVLQWDGPGLRIPNEAAAERFLRRSYRSGWQVAGL
jgi:predicted dehydrogenase